MAMKRSPGVEKPRHKCAVCGHDGGNDIVKLEELVGMSVWRCKDDVQCRRRLRDLRIDGNTEPQIARVFYS